MDMSVLSFRVVQKADAERVLEFHADHITEYLWPRTLDEFEQFARDECLFEVVRVSGEAQERVGICYVKQDVEEDNTTPRREFGGVYVLGQFRRSGVASALGKVAISNHFVWEPLRDGERMVGHVHEENMEPRGFLTNQLGFRLVGREIPPAHLAPPNMKRNKDGQVVGDLFEFDRLRLASFADWLEGFSGEVEGPSGAPIATSIDIPFYTDHLSSTLEALRDLSCR